MSAFVPEDSDTIIITQFILHTRQDDLERLGFRFHEQISVPNGVGTRVTIPPGWSKRRANEYEAKLYDSKVRHRASVADNQEKPPDKFNGGVYLKYRFYLWDSLGTPDFDEKGLFARVRMNTGNTPVTVYETATTSPTEIKPLNFNERMKLLDTAEKECKVWLDRHYPNWQDPLAYWDDE